MHVLREPLKSADLPRRGAVTIGNFDGVHRGHHRILRATVAEARKRGLPSVAMTFEPHPLKVLHPEQAPRMIQTLEQKEEAIERAGLEHLLLIPFTRDFSLTEPEEFVRDFLVGRLEVAQVCLGAHFAFGRGKRGDIGLLGRMGRELGFAANSVEEVFHDGAPISSTRIRQAIAGGNIREANAMLGRPYALDGVVVRGARLGRQLGYPTINLKPANELYPADGVYVCSVSFGSFVKSFACATNIGRRPTLYEDFETTIESCVLDFSADVYGENARLAFYERLREEKMFPSVSDLAAQIARDVEATRAYFAGRPEVARRP